MVFEGLTPDDIAVSISLRTTRPPGPLPWIVARSILASLAIFLARGEALTGPTFDATAAIAGVEAVGTIFCGDGSGVTVSGFDSDLAGAEAAFTPP